MCVHPMNQGCSLSTTQTSKNPSQESEETRPWVQKRGSRRRRPRWPGERWGECSCGPAVRPAPASWGGALPETQGRKPTYPCTIPPLRYSTQSGRSQIRGLPLPSLLMLYHWEEELGRNPTQCLKKIIRSSFFLTVLCWKRKITRSIKNSATQKKGVPFF